MDWQPLFRGKPLLQDDNFAKPVWLLPLRRAPFRRNRLLYSFYGRRGSL
jgi:hypothetical protein